MDTVPSFAATSSQASTDEQVIDAVLSGTPALYEVLIRRYNQRIYRVVRSIVPEDGAEDVMQVAYLRAYKNLGAFERRSSFSTWLSRIAVHEALARIREGKRFEAVDFSDPQQQFNTPPSPAFNPEEEASLHETRTLIEQGILALPQTYRTILVMRDVEEMSTSEAADALGVSETLVKVRLHRARALLRKELYARVGATSSMAFQFFAPRCDRVTQNVMQRIVAT